MNDLDDFWVKAFFISFAGECNKGSIGADSSRAISAAQEANAALEQYKNYRYKDVEIL